ncbi:MAG: hypothetical protein PSN04_07675 [Methyloprofundus sp.]|nr:hypothetical protein [Methyloprofundus sp.]
MGKIILFLVLWAVTKSFFSALVAFLVLSFIHFMVRAFWSLISEFGFFTAIFMLITFSWLFGGDD